MKNVFKKLICLLCALILSTACFACTASAGSGSGNNPPDFPCGGTDIPGGGGQGGSDSSVGVDDGDFPESGEITPVETEDETHNFELTSESNGVYTFTCSDCSKTSTLTVAYVSGTAGAYSLTGNTLTFSGITEKSEYSLSGEFYGNILIDGGENKLTLDLEGVKISSYTECPIYASGDKLTLSAKKGTENYIIDYRAEVTDETAVSACVYSECDLALQGKGTLKIKSVNNNGVHSKDDLEVKNLALQVECKDNALKGNDGVTVESGTLTLIATLGDGIKTSNSSVSSKGNKKGTVTLSGGVVSIYSSRDGIDAAYDVVINQNTESLILEIFTDKYSKYSEESASSSTQSAASSSENAGAKAEILAGFGGPGGGNPGGNPGGGNPGGNQGGGQGGFNDGNTDKGDYSTKGIKAGNVITISGGEIAVTSYDDAVHANGGETLENEQTSLGNVEISGGTLTLYTCDDGVHADGTLAVSGGTIKIARCYEGLEGAYVNISGGDISIISSDDGVNGTATSGAGITVAGGTLYVYAGGDGLDSNSTDSYGGIIFTGGNCVIISTGNSDSAIDTERGYKYEGGRILAIGNRGGMSGESTNCSSFSSVGKSTQLSLSAGAYLTADGAVTVKMPVSINALVLYLGNKSAAIASQTTSSLDFSNGNAVWLN